MGIPNLDMQMDNNISIIRYRNTYSICFHITKLLKAI